MRKENFPAWVTEHTVSVGIQCCRTKSAMCTAQGLMSVNTEASRAPLIPHKCTLREFSVGEPQGQVACGRKYDARGWGCPVSLIFECLSCFSYAPSFGSVWIIRAAVAAFEYLNTASQLWAEVWKTPGSFWLPQPNEGGPIFAKHASIKI